MIDYIDNIKKSKLTIYDKINVNDPNLWIPTQVLEKTLNDKLVGVKLTDSNGKKLANRTRSKKLKELVSKCMGYEIPKSFKKVQPRFTGQNLDIYGQESNNLQIWNEDIDPNRRYALIKIENARIIGIKIFTGIQLSALDTTGKLTQKFQARINCNNSASNVLSEDTKKIKALSNNKYIKPIGSPISDPDTNTLMSINCIFDKVKTIIGNKIPSNLNTRKQGEYIHKLVLKSLGYSCFADNGQFPDITNQLLEIKAQTSSTIDLGLFMPNDSSVIPDINPILGYSPTISDTRYLIVCIKSQNNIPIVNNIYLVTGECFFGNTIKPMQGKKINKKIQIPLPKNFLSGPTT